MGNARHIALTLLTFNTACDAIAISFDAITARPGA